MDQKSQTDTLYTTYDRSLYKITGQENFDNILDYIQADPQANNSTMLNVPSDLIGSGTSTNSTNQGVGTIVQNDVTAGTRTVVINDGQDIQTALNSLVQSGGGTLVLQAGNYIVKAPLTGLSSVRIEGESFSTTTINFNGTASNLIFSGSALYTTGTITSISGGVNVTGSGTAWLSNARAGQYIFFGTRWYLIAAVTSDTTLILAEGYGDSLSLPGLSYRIATIARAIELIELTIVGSTGTAVAFTDARDILVQDVVFTGNSKGLSFTNCSQISLLRTIVPANSSNGVEFTNVGLCNFTELATSGNGGSGVVLSGCKTIPFFSSASDDNVSDGYKITNCTDLFLQVECAANGNDGIELVSGNENTVITALVEGNTSDGIKLTASSNNTKIYASKIVGNGGYGINIVDSTSANTNITTSNFAGNASGAANDSGTGTVIRGNTGLADNANGSSFVSTQVALSNLSANDAVFIYKSIAPANPTHYYKLDESSGNASDSVGSLTLTNTSVTYGAGIINNGAIFNGSAALVSSSNIGITGTSARSINCWIKYTSTSGDGLVGWGATFTGQVFQMLIDDANNYLAFGGQSADVDGSGAALNDNNWHMLTITYDGTTVRLYTDGVAGNTGTPSLNTANTDLFVGKRWDGSNHFTGEIDEIGIWTSALSASDVTNLYNLGFAKAYPFTTVTYMAKTSASATSSSAGFVGFVPAAVTAGNTSPIITGGIMTGFSGLTIGAQYYLSNSPGLIASSAGANTRKVGIALSTSSLLITNIW